MTVTKKTKRRGNRHASAEIRLEELLNAAEICFGRYGYVGTTIDQIGAEAGLSKGTVYRFFDSKDSILIALLDRYEQIIEREIQVAIGAGMPHLDQIRLTQRTTLKILSSIPELIGVWQEFSYHDAAKPKFAKLVESARNRLATLIQEGIKAGVIKDEPVEAILDFLEAHKEGMLSLAVISEDFEPLSRFDNTWQLILHGISK